MLIYTKQITPRIQYVFDFVFTEQIGLSYSITDDEQVVKNNSSEKLAYHDAELDGLQIFNGSSILFEEGVQLQEIHTITWENINCPFVTGKGILPFDVFAAIFYLITRYEEYLPHEQNKYGQFQAKESFAFKNNFLLLPVIDIWIAELKRKIQAKYPAIKLKKKQFNTTMSYDMDTAYAYKGRTRWVSFGGWAKDALQMKFDKISKRIGVLFHNDKDEYDTYDHIIKSNATLKNKPLFFFLTGERGKFNKNINPQSNDFNQLVNNLKIHGHIGIHPSYESPRNKQMILSEKCLLENVAGLTVTKSRQHYLRFYMPTTYNHLLNCGITDDYTMGYAELPGFRASTCSTFYFYDVVADSCTNLKIHPITFMEGTFAEDMRLLPNEALPKMKLLIDEVKKVNGEFICIWHNHTISNTGFWRGWHIVHDEVIKAIQ
jgi:hypothetical protein